MPTAAYNCHDLMRSSWRRADVARVQYALVMFWSTACQAIQAHAAEAKLPSVVHLLGPHREATV